MPVQTTRSSVRVISQTLTSMLGGAMAFGLASAVSLAQSAGTVSPVPTPASGSETGRTATDLIAKATKALDSGRLIEAQATFRRLLNGVDAKALASADTLTVLDMMNTVDRRIKLADPVEISLQKAELLASEGDLRLAETQLAAARKAAKLSPEQTARATKVSAEIASQRQTLQPMAKDAVARSVEALDAGRYGDAKATLVTLMRSGVELSDSDRDLVESSKLRIDDLERQNGRSFESGSSMGLLQVGTVRRSPAPAPAPTAAPAAAPAAAPQEATNVASASTIVVADAQPPVEPPAQPSAEPQRWSPITTTVVITPAQPVTPPPAPADDLLTTAMRVETQALIAEADQLFGERRYPDAIAKYQRALAAGRQYISAAEIKHAEDKISEAQIAQSKSGNLGSTTTQQFDLVRQQTQAEFDNYLDQADKSIAAGDIPRARELAATADVTVARAKTYFSQTELDGFTKRRNDLTARINSTEEKQRIKEAKDRGEQLNKDATRRAAEVAAEKDRRVRDSITRVRALQQEQKYDEAIQVLDQILFMDPRNPAALLLKEMIFDVRVFQTTQKLHDRKALNQQKFRIENLEAAIPPIGVMNYPENWPTKTYQRSDSGSFLETPENRRTIGMMEKKIPAQFNGNSLAQVIEYVKRTADVNIDVDWQALSAAGIERETPINLALTHDAPARVVLERVLTKACKEPSSKPGFTVADGIVSVGTAETLNRYTVTQPYNVTDLMLLLDIPTYNDVPDLDLAKVVAASRDGGRLLTPFDGSGARKSGKNDRMGREEKMHRLVGLVQNSVDPDGWRDRGGSTGAIQELNGNLIITTTPANHREISGLLSKLRESKSMQINVESRFLTVNQDFFEQIGFNIDVYFNTNSSQVTAARGTDPNILPSDFFNFQNTNPLNRVLDSSTYAGGGSVNPVVLPPGTASRSLQNTALPQRWSPIGAAGNSLGITEGLANGFSPFSNTILGSSPALGVAGQFLDDVQVDFLIKATQADRRSTTLTAPRLTLTNGQTSNVVVGTQRSFIADLTPVTGESSVAFDPQPGVLTEGVTLLVEAVVSSDRRYVTLNIDTNVSQSQQPFRQLPVTAAVGGQLQSSTATNSFIELPTINSTRVQTTVTVPDEGTVLLGGQRIISEIEVETGVPVLSKIPIINRFFTNRIQSKTESTLLILVKPTIIIQTEEEEKNFPGLSDSLKGLGGN